MSPGRGRRRSYRSSSTTMKLSPSWRRPTVVHYWPIGTGPSLSCSYASGLRVSELTGLEISSCNLEERLIKVAGKGSKERIVPTGRVAAAFLKEYLGRVRPLLLSAAGEGASKTERVFLNHRGGPLSDRGVRYIFEKYIRQVSHKEGLTPHSLRHSFATHPVGTRS